MGKNFPMTNITVFAASPTRMLTMSCMRRGLSLQSSRHTLSHVFPRRSHSLLVIPFGMSVLFQYRYSSIYLGNRNFMNLMNFTVSP